MTSLYWKRDLEEAYQDPYEYAAQEQFLREARSVLIMIKKELAKKDCVYKKDDRSAEKAIWMLMVDALDTLQDSLDLLTQKKHRTASKLFRDVVESTDLAKIFNLKTVVTKKYLKEWYQDKPINNEICREILNNPENGLLKKDKSALYKEFCKFTHRSYRSLCFSYVEAEDEKTAYDNFYNLDSVHTISYCYALLGHLINSYAKALSQVGVIRKELIDKFWDDSLEERTEERGYLITEPTLLKFE